MVVQRRVHTSRTCIVGHPEDPPWNDLVSHSAGPCDTAVHCLFRTLLCLGCGLGDVAVRVLFLEGVP